MEQLRLPLNHADCSAPRRESILETMDIMMQAMGFGTMASMVNHFSNIYDWEDQILKDLAAEAHRHQIKKFNKRKAQRRAYCGGRKS